MKNNLAYNQGYVDALIAHSQHCAIIGNEVTIAATENGLMFRYPISLTKSYMSDDRLSYEEGETVFESQEVTEFDFEELSEKIEFLTNRASDYV